jgi:hypothetical protein
LKSIWQALKSKGVLSSAAVLLLLQIYSALTFVYVVFMTNASVSGSSSNVEGLAMYAAGSIGAVIMGVVFFLLCLSRVRTIFLLVANVVFFFICIGVFMLIPGVLPPQLVVTFFIFFWQYFLIYGFAYLIYFRLRSVYWTILSYSFWYFPMLLVAVSNRLNPQEFLDADLIISNLTLLWSGPEIFMAVGFLLLCGLLLLSHNFISLGRFLRDQRAKQKIGLPNYAVFGVLLLLALVVSGILGSLLWRARWEEEITDRRNEIEQEQQAKRPDEQEQRDTQQSQEGPISPGGKLPQGTGGAGSNKLFAAVSYEGGQGDALTGQQPAGTGNTTTPGKTSDPTTPSKTAAPQKTQYFTAEVYDRYIPRDGFTRNYYASSGVAQGPQYRGFYYDEAKLRQHAREQYQLVSLLSGESRFIFGQTSIREVGFLTKRKSPYLFGYRNGVISTNSFNPLRAGDSYYAISHIYDESDLSEYRSDTYAPSIVPEAPDYSFPNDIQLRSLANRIAPKGRFDNSFERLQALKKYLQENYEYDAEVDGLDTQNLLPAREEEETGPVFVSMGNVEAESPVDGPAADQPEQPEQTKPLTFAQVRAFILSGKGSQENKGSSSMFAASLVVLTEQLSNMPTVRIAGGFRTAQYDEQLASYLIYPSHLHYWNQVYTPEAGWIDLDVLDSIKQDEQTPPLDDSQRREIQDRQESDRETLEDREQKREDLRRSLEEDYFEFPRNEDNWEYNDEEFEHRDGGWEDEPRQPSQRPQQQFQSPITPEQMAQLMQILMLVVLCCCLSLLPIGALLPPLIKHYRWQKGLRKAEALAGEGDYAGSVRANYAAVEGLLKYYNIKRSPAMTYLAFANAFEASGKALSTTGKATYKLTGLTQLSILQTKASFARSEQVTAAEAAQALELAGQLKQELLTEATIWQKLKATYLRV